MSELVPSHPQQALALLEATGNLSPAGLRLPPDITYDQYEAIGVLLEQWGEGWKWAVGDWLIQGSGIFGDAFYQASELLQLSVRMRQQYMQVAEAVTLERRRPELKWSHHRAVCTLSVDEQHRWLGEAITNNWTKADLEDAVKGRIPEPPPLAFQPTGYVVERVLSAAERVYAAARVSDNPEFYLVDRRTIDNLADALGVAREDADEQPT